MSYASLSVRVFFFKMSSRLIVVALLLLQLLSVSDCFQGIPSSKTLPVTAKQKQQQQQQIHEMQSIQDSYSYYHHHNHDSNTYYSFALYQSDTTSDSYANEWYKSAHSVAVRLQEWRCQVTQTLLEVYQQRRQSLTTAAVSTALSNGKQTALVILQKSWWTLPLTLCFVPPISLLAWQQHALTPSWWKMTTMDYIWQQSCPAAAIVGIFLVSNICYFLAGASLLMQFPPQKVAVDVDNNFESSSLSSSSTTLTQQQWQFCRYSGLGLWVLAAGLMSTIFHSAQALCHNLLAEALCYLDHGIAGASVFYFWHVCGHPRTWNTLVCGVTGLVLLCYNSIPGYAWLHSAWHVFSAAAALMWAQQVKQEQGIHHGKGEREIDSISEMKKSSSM